MPVEPMADELRRPLRSERSSISALGCGDGKTESVLLHSLQRHLKMPSKTELFLLDISHSLLNAAYRHLT